MIVLGIETSSAVCSVGLVRDGTVVERSLTEDRIHSEKLLSLVDAVLAESCVSLSDIEGIAVSRGPGSFTGLRIGVSTAKGLATALQKPLVGVPTFSAVATALRKEVKGGKVLVSVDAKQGEWYVGVYDEDGTELFLGVETIAAVKAWMAPGTTVLTDKPAAFEGADPPVRDIRPLFRGGVIADFGRRRLQAGETDDTAAFEPSYLKDFVIRTSRSGHTGRATA